MGQYETVIGLEVHAQLLTGSKMFCGCNADYADALPNTHVCPVCLGMPGVLPVANERAIEYTVMTGLALNCTIPEFSKFDRKNYPYPDLMKGYQISQYDMPMCVNGRIPVHVDGQAIMVGITRVHLEEDTARLVHRTDEFGNGYSLVDVNRSGAPLMEIVSEPDMRSPEEARQYLISLRQTLQFLGVSTGNMEEGSFRCDANVSVRLVGSTELGAKVEVKNMNSFRAVFKALEYEVERQVALLESGGRVSQETRGWVEDRGITVLQRSKEFAHDYRYFPEPDLPPLSFSRGWVDSVYAKLPELPEARRARFVDVYGLSLYEADLLTETKAMADFYETALAGSADQARAKALANWTLGELRRSLNVAGIGIEDSKLRPEHLAEMLDLMDRGVISGKIGKTVFDEMFSSGKAPDQIVKERGLVQISDEESLSGIVDQAIAANPQASADYRAGKERAAGFLLGQIMKLTKGQANPAVVNRLLKDKLS